MDRIVIPQNATSTVCPVNVSEREAQINALVAKKINRLIKEHEREISDEDSFTRNYYLKEFTVEEYKKMIAEAEERLHKVPTDKYTTIEARRAYKEYVEKEIEYIKRDMQRMLDFKDYLKRVERDLYKQYPLNISHLIENVKSHIKKQILIKQKNITMEYHDRFMEKVLNLCPDNGKNFSKRIATLFKNRMSTKSMNVIYDFFKMLEYKLVINVNMFNNYDGNEYDKLQEILKYIVNRLINYFEMVITDFLADYIDSIPGGEMTDMESVETYTKYCIQEMNSALRQELPGVLDNAMKEKFEYMMEVLKYRVNDELEFNFLKVEDKAHSGRMQSLCEATESPAISYSEESPDVEVVITKPQVSSKPKRDFTEFLKTIGDEPIVNEDLVTLYNNFFGVNINTLSLSKMAEIRENFNVKRVTRSGKKVTVYTKK